MMGMMRLGRRRGNNEQITSQGVIRTLVGLKSRTTSTKPLLTMLALLMVCLFGVNESAWALRYGRAKAYSSPAAGGWVWVTKTNGNAPSEWEKTYDESSDDNTKIKDWTFPFYYYANAQTNYTFLGWATSSSTNTTVSTTQTNWYVGVTATSANNVNWNYATVERWALFGRLTANKSSETFGSVNVGSTSSAKEVKVTYVHAGKVTATLTGDFSFESGSSSKSKTLAESNTDSEVTDQSINIYFKPTCNSTRNGKLTIKSSNGLTDVEVNLSGTGNLNSQTLSWNNESQINLNMLNGTTQNISASATSGLTVSYESSNTDVLSVDANGKLTAKAVGGPVTITAKQAGDCTYSAATSITKTFYVKTKDTPSFSPSGFSAGTTNALKVDDEVTLGVSCVSDGLNGDFRASATKVNNQDILQITRNGNTITIKALREGTSTITFTQTENDDIFGATQSYTFTVTKVDNTLALKGSSYTRYVEEDDDLTSFVTTNSNGTIHTSSTAAGIARYDVTNNKLVINNSSNTSFNSTSVTIKIWQDATIKYAGIAEANAKTVTLTVKKYDNTIYVKGNENYSSSIYVDSYDNELTLTADNTDYTNCPITNTQTAGSDVATFYQNDEVVYSSYKLGTATWTLSQPENYKYQAGSGSFTVNVVTAGTTCDYVLNDPAEHGKNYSESEEYPLSGPGALLTLDVWKVTAATWGLKVYGYDANNNETELVEFNNASLTTDPVNKEVPLSKDYVKIKVQSTGGTLNKKFKNVKVTRYVELSASNLTIDKTSSNNPVYPSDGTGVGVLPITYSLAGGGNLKIHNDNPKFTLSQSVIENASCQSNVKTTNIGIQYNSDEAGTDVAHLVIYNDVYRKEVTITGITSKRNQTITWNVGNAIQVLSEIENAASVSANTEITYSTNNSDVIAIENGKLVAKGVGEATITVNAPGDDEYNAVEGSKTITVTSDLVQHIVWNQSLLGLHTGDADKTLNAYATSDVDGCTTNGGRAIIYSSSDESVVKIVNGNKLQVIGKGTAYVTASQAGGLDDDGHTYMAVIEERKAIVRDLSDPCEAYVYQQTGTATMDLGWNWLSQQDRDTEIALSAEPDQMTFRYKFEKKSDLVGVKYGGGTMYVEQYIDEWSQVGDDLTPSEGDYQTATVALDRHATKVRIRAHGVGYHSFTDCQISMLRYIETSELATFEAKVGQEAAQNMTLSYSNITGPVTLILGHTPSNFSVSQTAIEGSCGDHNSVNITVTYTPIAATEEETELLRISDGVTTHDISLTGVATVTNRYISWDIPSPNSVYTVETVNLSAQALTSVGNSPAGSVFYTKGELSTTGNLSGSTLTFSNDGVAYIAAQGVADPKYNATDIITKTFNVSKTPTSISVAPTVETIVSGTAAEDVVLNTASAVSGYDVNGFSGTVPGTWSVIEEDLNTVGENRSIKIHFEPSNTDMFIGCDGYINNVTVSQREATEEEVIGAATAITYGETAAGASTLSNDGTLAGTWAWTDSRKNDQLAVGTYDDMQARFTPNNGNIQPKDITVSLTVNQATPTLNWTSAATELAYNASATYTATSTSNEGAITYSIETGASYAEIDENTGALTIIEAGHDITVKATQAASANYIAASITVNVTIAATPIVNTFIGNGGWENPNNWSEHVVPNGDAPTVIVSGALSIDENVTVGNLTIESTGSIAVITGGTLTVKGVSETRAEYGDVHVLNDGALALINSANLQVRHFTLDAKLAGKNNANVKEAAASGQVENPNQLAINGDAYFQMAFDPKGKISFGWYDFVVPFPVNISDGIFREGDLVNHLVSGVDFIVQEHSESKCANNQKAWTNFYGTMEPGRVYTIGFNYDPNFDQNVFVFKKANGAIIGGPTEFATQYTEGSGTTDDYGWNGLGNGMLKHGYVTGTFAHMQVYNHAENKYDMLTGKNPTFAIGTSFFVQVDNSTPTMEWHAANANEDHPLFAPKREAIEVEEFLLSLREENQVDASDHLYISASEEATEAYVIGRDLRKMGTPTEAKTAQMWTTKGGKNLCDIETRMVNYKASSDLYFFAPQATTFELTAEEMPENATLYLTKNGKAIWNLSMSPYELNLEQGTTEGYGLRIVASQQTTTDIENGGLLNDANGVRKVLIDNVIYIVTPEGEMYDIVGKSVKY